MCAFREACISQLLYKLAEKALKHPWDDISRIGFSGGESIQGMQKQFYLPCVLYISPKRLLTTHSFRVWKEADHLLIVFFFNFNGTSPAKLKGYSALGCVYKKKKGL